MDIHKTTSSHAALLDKPVDHVRDAIRKNAYSAHTAGLCTDKLQCNFIVLNSSVAKDFEQFCKANLITCPLVAVSDVGDPKFTQLGDHIDVRTDLPSYNIYKQGQLVEKVHDIRAYWSDNLVAFAIGCSFTFERALVAQGIPMRHIDNNVTVPMYQSNLPLNAVGSFGGQAVVSMRPINHDDVEKVYEICRHYPHAHGEPLHVGDAGELGITDLKNPDWGHSVNIEPDETPVFWGCGVTTQVAITQAKVDLCIAHTPGCMLITDVDELSFSE